MISIDEDDYFAKHKHRPSGTQEWTFYSENYSWQVTRFGTYDEALDECIEFFKKQFNTKYGVLHVKP